MHGANIRDFFQNAPLAGSPAGAARGIGHGQANAIAARMALQARVNAATRFEQRTSSLVTSVVPIVRHHPSRGTEVGVGTKVEHGYWLEAGTEAHIIRPQVPFRGRGKGGYLLRSNGPNSKGPNPDPLERAQMIVQHPGNTARHWMSDAVRSVIPGALVSVRRYF